MAGSRRPSFIFFNPDELRADAVHHLDGRPVHTQNLDRLAAEGITFGQCHVQNTVCTPSRCSFMTGWYPHVRGHRTLYHALQPHEPNLLRTLKQAGYNVVWHGKNDLLAQGSFPDSVSYHCDRQAPRPTFPPNPYPRGHRLYRSFCFGCRGEAPYLDSDEMHVREACEFLRNPGDDPFFLFLPLTFPHPPYTVEEPFFSRHDPAKVPDPLPALLDDKPHYMRALREDYGTAAYSPEEWREMVATYYGMVSRIDDQLGRILDSLESSPARDDTVVLVMSDHGDYVGDYGLVEKWPTGLQDVLTRVPMIWRLPDVVGPTPRHRSDALVESIDLVPTVLEASGVEASYDHFGRSLLPLIRGETDEHRDAVFAEGGHGPTEKQSIEPWLPEDFVYYIKTARQQLDPSTVAKAAMVRTPTHKYVARLVGGDELYDLASDPGELVNRADDRALADVKASLKDRLLRWYLETGDVVPREMDPRRV